MVPHLIEFWLWGPYQEYSKFVTFTSALLSRSSKLSELVGQLEMELGEKDPASSDGKRVAKPQTQTCIRIQFLNTS